eukprot:gene4482-6726_t
MSGLPADDKPRTLEAITARLSGQTQEKIGACKKCGYVGHLPFQCRNYIPIGPSGQVHLDVSSTSSDSELSGSELGYSSDDDSKERPSRHVRSGDDSRSSHDRKHYRSRRERDRLHGSSSDGADSDHGKRIDLAQVQLFPQF